MYYKKYNGILLSLKVLKKEGNADTYYNTD